MEVCYPLFGAEGSTLMIPSVLYQMEPLMKI